MTTPCPGRDGWKAILKGASADFENSDSAAHLEACSQCQEIVEKLYKGRRTFLEVVGHLRKTQLQGAGVREAMEKLRRQSPVAGVKVPSKGKQPNDQPETVRAPGVELIRFWCSNCQKQLSVSIHATGKRARCSKCRALTEVPALETSAGSAIETEEPIELEFAEEQTPTPGGFRYGTEEPQKANKRKILTLSATIATSLILLITALLWPGFLVRPTKSEAAELLVGTWTYQNRVSDLQTGLDVTPEFQFQKDGTGKLSVGTLFQLNTTYKLLDERTLELTIENKPENKTEKIAFAILSLTETELSLKGRGGPGKSEDKIENLVRKDAKIRSVAAKTSTGSSVESNVRILANPEDVPIEAKVVSITDLSQFGKLHAGTKPADPQFYAGSVPQSFRALVVDWTTKDRDAFAANYRFPSISGERCHAQGMRGDSSYYPVPALGFAKMQVSFLPIVCVIEGGPGGPIRSGFVQGGGVLRMVWPIPATCSNVSLTFPGRQPIRMEFK